LGPWINIGPNSIRSGNVLDIYYTQMTDSPRVNSADMIH